MCEDGSLTWDEVLDAFEAGLVRASAEAPEVTWGLVCIASRDYGPESAAETAEFYLAHRHRFVGFDLAGDEARWPARLFESAVAPILRARRLDPSLHVTIHAGEGAGPQSVWEALDLLGRSASATAYAPSRIRCWSVAWRRRASASRSARRATC